MAKKKNGKQAFIGPLPKPKPKKQRKQRNPASIPGYPSLVTSSIIAPKRALKLNHHRATCSISDPFCVHAKNAQRPDGGPPTIAFQLRQLFTVNADSTSGTGRVYMVAGFGKYTHLTAVTSTTNWQNNTTLDAATQTFVTTNARECRIVSFGCIVRSAMTATTAKGSVILTVEPTPPLNGLYPKGNLSAIDSVIMPLAAGLEYTFRSKPCGPAAHIFRNMSAVTTTTTDFDWTSLAIEVVGSDTTSAIPYLTVEYVMNVEFTMSTGDTIGMAQLMKAPGPPSRPVLAAADQIHANAPSFIQGGITKATQTLEGYATKALDSIISEGLMFLGL